MRPTTKAGLAARALATTIIHGSVLGALALVLAGTGGVLGLLFGASLLDGYREMNAGSASGGIVEPVALLVVPGFAVLILAAGVYNLWGVVRTGRERLLARVDPADLGRPDGTLDEAAHRLAALGPDDEDAPDPELRERVRALFDQEGAGDPDDGTDADPDEPGEADALTDEERRRFVESVTRLAAQAGVPAPTPGVHPTEAPLCYTVHHGGHVYLVVSRGLLRALPPAELAAALAHEVAHLANRDHRLMTWAMVPLVATEEVVDTVRPDSLLPDWLDHQTLGLSAVALVTATVLVYLLARTSSLLALVGFVVVFVVAGLLFVVVPLAVTVGAATLAGTIAYWWAALGTGLFSRGRELAADRAAARLTGDPGALASALERLDDSLSGPPPADLRDHVHTRDALNVLPALDPERDGGGGLLATHPATETRVERLRELEREQETA